METANHTVLELLSHTGKLYAADFASNYYVDLAFLNDLELYEDNLYGSVILKKRKEGYTVIDGIQRLVTFSLLLYALCECYKRTSAKNDDAREKIFYRYLTFKDLPKIRLKGEDSRIYDKIILSEKLTPEEKESPIFLVLHDFWIKIKEDNISASKLFRQISQVKFFVSATEDQTVDELDLYACCIHNSINYVTLIEKFIEARSLKAFEIWNSIVDKYKENQEFFEQFLRDYLSISLKGSAQCANLYESFKHFWSQVSKYQDLEFMIESMSHYSDYYLKIVNAQFDNINIQNQFFKIRENSGQDAYPYIMEVMDDYENGHLTQDMFLDILKMVSDYVEKRDLNSQINFSNLSKELNKMLASKIYS